MTENKTILNKGGGEGWERKFWWFFGREGGVKGHEDGHGGFELYLCKLYGGKISFF